MSNELIATFSGGFFWSIEAMIQRLEGVKSIVSGYAEHGAPISDQRAEKSEIEWKNILTHEQFRVTREDGTERAFTGAYYNNYAPEIYTCICCDEALFHSKKKV